MPYVILGLLVYALLLFAETSLAAVFFLHFHALFIAIYHVLVIKLFFIEKLIKS